MSQVKPVPAGYHSLTPSLVFPDSIVAITLYKKVFEAEQIELIKDGEIVVHAEIKIGDSVMMMADENPQWGLKCPATVGGTASSLYHYVEDVDAVTALALDNGFTEVMPVTDMFWGDRFSQVQDPFGHVWGLATHKEDVDEAEIQRRMDDMRAE